MHVLHVRFWNTPTGFHAGWLRADVQPHTLALGLTRTSLPQGFAPALVLGSGGPWSPAHVMSRRTAERWNVLGTSGCCMSLTSNCCSNELVLHKWVIKDKMQTVELYFMEINFFMVCNVHFFVWWNHRITISITVHHVSGSLFTRNHTIKCFSHMWQGRVIKTGCDWTQWGSLITFNEINTIKCQDLFSPNKN